MKRNKKMIFILSVLLIISLSGGGIVLANSYPGFYNKPLLDDYGFRNGYGMMGGFNKDFGFGNYRGGMGYSNNYTDYQYNSNLEKMSIEEIQEAVEGYLSRFDEKLEIGDIFIYLEDDYYVSIEEEETGKGAMELLINPYTGYVYPEQGPNMMWNEKYGMHGFKGYGMHGSRGYGMMGSRRGNFYGSYNSYDRDNNYNANLNKISKEEAVKIAEEYVKQYINKDYTVVSEGHEFYGYYTLHVNKENQTTGMLSVNYDTGVVWYHTWHGDLLEVISGHH